MTIKELIIKEFNSRTTCARRTVTGGDRKLDNPNSVMRNSVIFDNISYKPFRPNGQNGFENINIKKQINNNKTYKINILTQFLNNNILNVILQLNVTFNLKSYEA